MSNAPTELTNEELSNVITRDRFVKEQMGARIASLVQENLELVALVQQMQGELRQHLKGHTPHESPNGDVEVVTPQARELA